MPEYTFDCNDCDFNETVRLKMSERDDDRFCPNCRAILRRIISVNNQPIIIYGDRQPIKKIVPKGVTLDQVDRDWAKDT